MDEKYMEAAIKEAKKAYKKDEVPVGAIITYKDKIIARGHNLRQQKHNVLCHAEIIAIEKAAKKLKDWRLDECCLYVTLKPCEMCQAVIETARISTVYYLLDSNNNQRKKHTQYVQTNVRVGEENILSKFFKNKR